MMLNAVFTIVQHISAELSVDSANKARHEFIRHVWLLWRGHAGVLACARPCHNCIGVDEIRDRYT